MLKLDKNKKYLLACSFGPDSMALFDMLIKNNYIFDVAHVNYHFRKESDLEENNLSKYCASKNINLYVFDNKEKVSSNLEAKAREIRYNYFNDLYNKNHYDALLVAHHYDDNLETYLLQKKRNIKVFYYGIKEISYYKEMKIIRPLLNEFKEDLLEYCKKNNVPYSIDLSNEKDDYLRNKIRHHELNKLSKEEKINLGKLIDQENANLEALLNELDKDKIHQISYLLNLDNPKFQYALYYLANEKNIYNLSLTKIKEIHKLLSSKKPNIYSNYKNYIFVKEYDNCYFLNQLEEVNYSYVINGPMVLDCPYFYLDFTKDSSNRNVFINSYPLTIRNYQIGDKYRIKDYQKDVNRLFIDWKMPLSLRKRWPIIINKDGEIIYIPRYREDFIVNESINFYVK